MKATNRQRKVLRFFEIDGWDKKTFEEASRIITTIFADPSFEDLYNRYVYFTDDFDRDSDELKPFSMEDLKAVELPPGWDRKAEDKKAKDVAVAAKVQVEGFFDDPQPKIDWSGTAFVLTGRFNFGSKKECEKAIAAKGGEVFGQVSAGIDYLIVGGKGSMNYSEAGKGYGEKIKAAITLRNEFGRPKIITEEHWRDSL